MATICVTLFIILCITAVTVMGDIFKNKSASNVRLDACQKMSRNPYFEMELITRKRWRMYYMWDKGYRMNRQIRCNALDTEFKKVSKTEVNSFWSDMNEYLEQQPNWFAAELIMSMGMSRRALLCVDQGPAGSFVAVPNVVRSNDIPPARGSVSLIKLFMKLVRGGKYLIVMSCTDGISTLMASSRDIGPSEMEATILAKDLGIDGYLLPCYRRN